MAESTTAPPFASTVLQLSSCPSNCSINNLTDSLLNEIFCRLPCASAFQCKCVCKRWQSLISHPYFTRCFIDHHCRTSDHHHPLPFTLVLRFNYFHDNSPDDSKGVIHQKILAVSENNAFQSNSFFLNFLPCFRSSSYWSQLSVVASWKDLLIVGCSRLQTVYFICNPLTRQWLELPLVSKYLNDSNTLVGFVLDGCADAQEEYCSVNVATAQFEYKLVCISDTGIGLTTRQSSASAWIFSSVIGEWSKSEVPLSLFNPRSVETGGTNGVAFKRMLHWINGKAILVYDPDSNNQFRSIVLPTSLRTTNARLGVSQEHLCVTQLKPEVHGYFVMVWKLQDYNNNNNTGTWCLEFKACLREMVTVDSFRPCWASSESELLALHPYDGGVAYLRDGNEVYVCNLQTRTLKMVRNEIVDRHYTIRRNSVFPLAHPCWPTPVPSARSNSISPAN
ncbi:hypothetical protein Ancab_005311 [Ancistrocladus abbreviatus]